MENKAISILKTLGIYEPLKKITGKRELLEMFLDDFDGLVEIVLQAKEKQEI